MGSFNTPEDVALLQQLQDTQSGAQAGALGPVGNIISGGAVGGRLIGRGAAGAFGYQDPMMAQAQKLQAARVDTENAGIDYSRDPVSYMNLAAKNLFKYGLYDQGMQVADKVKDLAQGQAAQAQAQKAGYDIYQQQRAEQAITNIWQQAKGDQDVATQLMVQNPNPLVQKRGLELQTGKYTVVAPGSGVLNNRTGQMVDGIDTTQPTDLSKEQARRTALQAALDGAKKNSQPQSYIDGLQKQLDESEDKIKLISQGTPKTAMDERAMKRLMGQQLISDFGLTPEQANAALSGNASSLVSGGMDPNKVNQIIAKTRQMQTETDQAILNQQHMVIDPVTNKPMYIQPLTVPPSITVGKAGATAGTNPSIPTNQVPTMDQGRKALDSGTEKKFTDIGNGLQQMNMFAKDFKPEYGGFGSELLGEGAIQLGRRVPDSKYADTANYWSSYRQWLTDVRAAKFGMTLTGYELKAFNQYTSNPSDSPAVIQNNMQRQFAIVNAAAQRELGALSVSGQNVKQGETLSGVKMLTKQPSDEPIVRPANQPDSITAQKIGGPTRDMRSGMNTMFQPGRVYTDAKGNKAMYNADGSWTPQ